MRYRFEWQASHTVYHKEGGKVTGRLPLVSYLSWILFMTAGSKKNDCFLLQWTNGAGLSGTHFVIFVTPLAIVLCQPFRFEQMVTGDTGSFFHRINCLHFSTLWAIDWCDCIITAGYRYVYRTCIAFQWFAILLWYISTQSIDSSVRHLWKGWPLSDGCKISRGRF